MNEIMGSIEKQYRLKEAAEISGQSIPTLRRKIRSREIGYARSGKIITIPASELARMIGVFVPPKPGDRTR